MAIELCTIFLILILSNVNADQPQNSNLLTLNMTKADKNMFDFDRAYKSLGSLEEEQHEQSANKPIIDISKAVEFALVGGGQKKANCGETTTIKPASTCEETTPVCEETTSACEETTPSCEEKTAACDVATERSIPPPQPPPPPPPCVQQCLPPVPPQPPCLDHPPMSPEDTIAHVQSLIKSMREHALGIIKNMNDLEIDLLANSKDDGDNKGCNTRDAIAALENLKLPNKLLAVFRKPLAAVASGAERKIERKSSNMPTKNSLLHFKRHKSRYAIAPPAAARIYSNNKRMKVCDARQRAAPAKKIRNEQTLRDLAGIRVNVRARKFIPGIVWRL